MKLNLPAIAIENFRKPDFICNADLALEGLHSTRAVTKYIESRKAEIHSILAGFGLRLRFAHVNETAEIKNMVNTFFSPKAATHVSKYDVFRYIRFGYSTVVEDENQKIVACKLAIGFDKISGISHSFVSLVLPEWQGKQIAFLISSFSCLLALERGSRIQRATVNPLNFASVKSLVNKVGFICHDFHPAFFGKGEPRYVLCIPMSPAGLSNNEISDEKVNVFLATHQSEIDYKLLRADDLESIGKMYLDTGFRVVALVPGVGPSGHHHVLALPKELLNFSESEEAFFQTCPGDE